MLFVVVVVVVVVSELDVCGGQSQQLFELQGLPSLVRLRQQLDESFVDVDDALPPSVWRDG